MTDYRLDPDIRGDNSPANEMKRALDRFAQVLHKQALPVFEEVVKLCQNVAQSEEFQRWIELVAAREKRWRRLQHTQWVGNARRGGE